MSAEFILETQGLTKGFKGFVAVTQVGLKVQRGHIHALIGPNGAGKSTVFNLLTKLLRPTAGTILFNGMFHSMECYSGFMTVRYGGKHGNVR